MKEPSKSEPPKKPGVGHSRKPVAPEPRAMTTDDVIAERTGHHADPARLGQHVRPPARSRASVARWLAALWLMAFLLSAGTALVINHVNRHAVAPVVQVKPTDDELKLAQMKGYENGQAGSLHVTDHGFTDGYIAGYKEGFHDGNVVGRKVLLKQFGQMVAAGRPWDYDSYADVPQLFGSPTASPAASPAEH